MLPAEIVSGLCGSAAQWAGSCPLPAHVIPLRHLGPLHCGPPATLHVAKGLVSAAGCLDSLEVPGAWHALNPCEAAMHGWNLLQHGCKLPVTSLPCTAPNPRKAPTKSKVPSAASVQLRAQLVLQVSVSTTVAALSLDND